MFEELFARVLAALVRVPADTCLSRGALVEGGDDLGQVSSYSILYLLFQNSLNSKQIKTLQHER
jgi:hypothetical protein